MQSDILGLGRILWDYNNLASRPKSADALIVMGTNDLGVPVHAANIASIYSYKWIVVSGGVSHTSCSRLQPFGGTEAEIFCKTMIQLGCPANKILVENNARNTGQNITESQRIFHSRGILIRDGHLVHTPMMQRRALATARRQWSDIEWSISGQDLTFDEYILDLNIHQFLNGLVGDTYRILHYPKRGFQVPQPMPLAVRNALKELIQLGFKKILPADYDPFLLDSDGG